MTQPSLHIIPQQYIRGHGWLECEPHRAKTWSVFVNHICIGRHPRKADATEQLRSANRALRKAERSYALGQRMPKRDPAVGTVVRISN